MRAVIHEIVDVPSRPWRIACICDADGDPGAACAVTVGLHHLDLPELFLPARPANHDPGDGWRLSHRDLTGLLANLGDTLLEGNLWDRDLHAELDTGLAAARLRPGYPVSLAALDEALGSSATSQAQAAVVRDLLSTPDDLPPGKEPGAGQPEVTLIQWEIGAGPRIVGTFLDAAGEQDPVAPAEELAAELAQVRGRTATLRAEILEHGGRPGRVPARWRANPRQPAHPPRHQRPPQRFGPRHPVVVARAEQVLLADVRLLKAFLTLAWDLADDTAGEILGAIGSLAGATGRWHVPTELEVATADVTTLLTGRHGDTMRWRRAFLAQQPRICTQHRRHLERVARARLSTHVHALLATEAFADILPTQTAARGRLSWSGALEMRRHRAPRIT